MTLGRGLSCPSVSSDRPPPPPDGYFIRGSSLVGGRDFNGSPNIHIDVSTTINPTKKQVVAFIDLNEDTSGTNFQYRYPARVLYTVPNDRFRIVAVTSPMTSTLTTRGPSAGAEFGLGCNNGPIIPSSAFLISGGLVTGVEMIGDTGGDDVSDDADCDCDSRINRIEFARISVLLADNEVCPDPDPYRPDIGREAPRACLTGYCSNPVPDGPDCIPC